MALPRYDSLSDYNGAHPEAAIPTPAEIRNGLRSYTAAGAGVEDDLLDLPGTFTIDFLPGGAPRPDEPDQRGTVVASRWGTGPILVLAHDVSLRAAWNAVLTRWPTTLSATHAALDGLTAALS